MEELKAKILKQKETQKAQLVSNFSNVDEVIEKAKKEMIGTITTKTLELNGYEIKVTELENAMIDANGRKLYEVTVDGDEFDNIRAYNIDDAVKFAKSEVINNF